MIFGGKLLVLIVALLVSSALADLRSHTYTQDEQVKLYVNKVGPFRNPQETYQYYSLPFCTPDTKSVPTNEGLGAALQGYDLRESMIRIEFNRNYDTTTLCPAFSLDENQYKQFFHAIKNQYWYQMFLDDLPIWGMVGETKKEGALESHYLYTHKKFTIARNGNQVIEVNMRPDNPVEVKPGAIIAFTYQVIWEESNIAFEDRFDRYLDNAFFEHQIHWYAIFNSFMMVIFLVGLVSMILLRALRKDFDKFSIEEGLDDDREEFGWKQIHGDVFRRPQWLNLFSTLIGTGHQLILLVFCVLLLALYGPYYKSRGATVTVFIICYAFTSFVGGYGGGGFYARNGGKNWIKNMLLTATLFPSVCFGIIFFLNIIAVAYDSMSAVPFGTELTVVAIWMFVSLPLTMAGTIVGRNWSGKPDYPCRINTVPRQIPEKQWYLRPWAAVILGGALPFISIFIEMYFIFTSFWHYKYYYVYGFMLLVFIILIIVTLCVTIVSIYFLLNSEDYRWHWTSFLSGASTALYVFFYSIYYFKVKTKMSGFFQTSYYFGYMFMFSLALGILCGSVGFIGSSVFIQRIYRNKID